jgi:transketolase
LESSLHKRCVNTIKGLAMDGVQAANSGHPGMPMGAADMATVLWTRFLKYDPADPQWPDRDRFVLSAGHGSMLLYSLLHLSGYDLPLDELKNFRQWGSKTPGHPEYGHTPGVETTTGPLGQGFANGVGMAIAERFLRENFGDDLCDHYIYGICGDGDLMEGVAYEAASIAGHLGLGRLIFLFDDNNITIDGEVGLSHSENVTGRLAATGWHVQSVDGHDPEAIAEAIEAARSVTGRPSLIACRTVIGQGSPSFEGTSRTHGAPLGPDEVAATKTRIGLDPSVTFATPAPVIEAFRNHDGASAHGAWSQRLANHPRADEFKSWLDADGLSLANRVAWPTFESGSKLATRKASLACLKSIVAEAPWVIGGSADLAGSNGTKIGLPMFEADSFKNAATLNFGIREHAMGSICNGIALHGGARPYGATFLMFHDYQRPAVRLSGLMNVPVTWIYTHDSVFLGEDGPTHQPIATLLALRSIPNLEVWRPGDAHETVVSWRAALENSGPTALILTRQGLPVSDQDTTGAARGGYVIHGSEQTPDVCLLATGSEVATCIDAARLLSERGVAARVVSLPCRERFWKQDASYKDDVLPPGIPRVSVEAGVTLGWERWTGETAAHIGIDTYGHSAPASVIAEKLGFTGSHVARVAQDLIAR